MANKVFFFVELPMAIRVGTRKNAQLRGYMFLLLVNSLYVVSVNIRRSNNKQGKYLINSDNNKFRDPNEHFNSNIKSKSIKYVRMRPFDL